MAATRTGRDHPVVCAAAEQPRHQYGSQFPVELPVAVRYRLEPMRPADVAEVSQVERHSFTNPWPTSAYRRELQNVEQNHYIVLRGELDADHAFDAESRSVMPRRLLFPLSIGRRALSRKRTEPVIGFAGMWHAFDEAHVTTIAVDQPWRGRGLGELLLAALFDEATRRGANWLTLEVRVSNESAQGLYRKWGFAIQGTRRRYYSDNNEDAYIMWSKAISDPAYREQLARLRRAVLERMPVPIEGFPESPPPTVVAPPTGKPPWEP